MKRRLESRRPQTHIISLFASAARSLRSVSIDGDHCDVEPLPSMAVVPTPPGRGISDAASAERSAVSSGASTLRLAPSFAGKEIVSIARPYRQALMTLRAAASALIDSPGMPAPMLNH